jgi:hypothetical protein
MRRLGSVQCQRHFDANRSRVDRWAQLLSVGAAAKERLCQLSLRPFYTRSRDNEPHCVVSHPRVDHSSSHGFRCGPGTIPAISGSSPVTGSALSVRRLRSSRRAAFCCCFSCRARSRARLCCVGLDFCTAPPHRGRSRHAPHGRPRAGAAGLAGSGNLLRFTNGARVGEAPPIGRRDRRRPVWVVLR